MATLSAGTRLGPYELLGLIGAGGMGEVYKARDTRLDRTVAIKVLPHDLAADPERRSRFEREARTISGLNHPHICTLHDIGEADGQAFLVMEYLDGETLARRLSRGPLPVREALEIGAEIAEALDGAHRHGIVHRDLKPGNVMLTSGGAGRSGRISAKLLDFGLAKPHARAPMRGGAPAASSATVAEPLTERGVVLGTVQYMAPEQLEGREADARTDLWALGAILYEMLTGKRAFEGESQASLIGSIMHLEPAALSTVEPLTPPALERVVRRCLAKHPDGRWDSAHDVADELRWIAQSDYALSGRAGTTRRVRPSMWSEYRFIGRVDDGRRHGVRRQLLVGGAAVLVALALGWWGLTRWARPSPTIDSLAVLPFANLTGSPEQQHFVDAMHDAVIAELGQIRALTVISRQSVLRYRDTQKSVPEIARELAVDAVVEGSVFRASDTVQITLQLLQARPVERHLWAHTFHGDLRDVLVLQGQVAQAISAQIPVTVTPDELGRLARGRPVDPAAYEAWLRGWVERNRTSGPSLERCIGHAKEAAAIDPDYGAAYVLAADCYIFSHWLGASPLPPWDAFPKAKAAAQRAIQVDESMGQAHGMLGFVTAAFDWDWAGADRAFKRAIELAPGDASIRCWYSYFLNWMARHDEAIEHARRAEQLSPGLPPSMMFVTAALLWARRYDEALAQGQRTVELFPEYAMGHEWLSYAYDLKGMYLESLAEQEEAVRLTSGVDVNRKGLLGRAYARAGRRSDALRVLAELLHRQETSYISPALFAYLYIGLGQTGNAIDWLERGYVGRDPNLAFLNTFPPFDPLRSDPRFQALLRRMNFPR